MPNSTLHVLLFTITSSMPCPVLLDLVLIKTWECLYIRQVLIEFGSRSLPLIPKSIYNQLWRRQSVYLLGLVALSRPARNLWCQELDSKWQQNQQWLMRPNSQIGRIYAFIWKTKLQKSCEKLPGWVRGCDFCLEICFFRGIPNATILWIIMS